MTTYTQTPLTSRIYGSRTILLEQLKNQGYDISNYENFGINEIHAMKENSQLDMLVKNENNKKIYVKYHVNKKIQPSYIYGYIEDIYNIDEVLTKDDKLIIIVNDNINQTIKKYLEELLHDGYFVIVFTLEELSYNILNHSLVPHHRVLNEQETNEIKEKYNIVHNNQFPEISRFDPVAKVIGIRPGQVCEITRKSKTAITSKFYRFCS